MIESGSVANFGTRCSLNPMLCICVVRVDIWQRFETVEDVVKHFHLNPIDLVLTDGAKKRSDTFRVMLKYRAS